MSCKCQDQKDFQAENEGRRKIKFKNGQVFCAFCKEVLEAKK